MTFTTEGSNPTSAVTNNAAIAAEIDVKASFKLQIRRFKLASDANIFTLKGRLISLFSIPAESPIVLLYKDDENDLVTMNLDEEMKYAIKVSNGLLRVEIRIEGEMQASPSAPAADNSCDKPWKQMRKGHGPHGLHGPHGFHGHGPFFGPRSHHGPFAQAPQTETQDVESPVSKWEGRRGGRWRCSEQDASAQSGPENERGCKDRLKARHVKDITIPDGTVVLSGVPFVKTWRIRNAGTVDWPAKTRLLFISHKGDHMGGPEFVVIEGIVKAGEETDVSVNFVAPSEPGDYSGFWRMATEDGKKFGQRFWVDIKVAAADKSSSDSSDFEHIPAPIEYEKLGKQVQQMFPEVPERRIKHLLTKFGGNVNTVVERLNARRECKVRRGGEGRRCGENKKH